jgi:hypothetical protein
MLADFEIERKRASAESEPQDDATASYRLEKNAHTPFDAKLGQMWPPVWTHQITGALVHW